jgi:hypothetical protein
VLSYAYGGDDFFIIADVPDSVTATAVSLAVNATGAVQFKTIVLITPEKVDAAVQKTVPYRPSANNVQICRCSYGVWAPALGCQRSHRTTTNSCQRVVYRGERWTHRRIQRGCNPMAP